jgi:hypothetical protein
MHCAAVHVQWLATSVPKYKLLLNLNFGTEAIAHISNCKKRASELLSFMH